MFATEQAANNYNCQYADCNYASRPPQTASFYDNNNVRCSAGYLMGKSSKVANPAYDPNAVPDDKPKSIPLEVVAAQVI